MPAIRSYAPDDRDHLVEIWERASRVGHPFLTEQDLQEQKILVREVYLPSTENWVAVGNGKPLGFIGLIENFVGGLFVDPAAHKLGIGRSLIEHAAARKGVLQVEVYAKNDAALGFYQHMGFFEQGRRPVDDQGRELQLVRLERAAGVGDGGPAGPVLQKSQFPKSAPLPSPEPDTHHPFTGGVRGE